MSSKTTSLSGLASSLLLMLFDCYDGVIWFTRYTFFSDPLTLPLELGLLDDGRAYSFFDYLVATD